MSDLNPAQLAAVRHGDGPLLIIAGAGTGKTRTLVHRVAHLIERGVRPERILLLTFTRRAADEMLGRVERLIGASGQRVQGGTFHGTAHRLLRRFGPAAGLAANFTIMDQEDAADLLHLSRSQLGIAVGERAKRFPKKETLQYLYSRHINTGRPLLKLLTDELPHFAEYAEDIGRIIGDYARRKADRNLLDYDDLLLFWAALLEAPPPSTAADRIAALYDHILVDEYQDTNALQSRILDGMCRTHVNLTVVGDDAQSIYGFRGATVRNILDFPTRHAGATLVTLEQNYRSSQPILDVSNAVIARARERFTKALWTTRRDGETPWLVTARDETEQTDFVVGRVLELYRSGMPLREMAVLFRAGYMSAALEIELTNRKIPFEKWGGLKFLEAAHIKDVLAFLRVLENPRDEVSWYRILRLLPGVGDATARGAIAALEGTGWEPTAVERYRPPARAQAAHASLVGLLRALRGHEPPLPVSLELARVRGVYDVILRDRYDRPEPRLADLDQLEAIANGYPSRTAFLATLALEPPSNTHDLAGGDTEDADDVLVLSTAHSAKGKEWDAVFLVWAADGWFPTTRALNDEEGLDEERRLMYVALTRARRHLAVSYPMQVYGAGPQRRTGFSIDQLSRFIDPDVRGLMQRIVIEQPDPTTLPLSPAVRAALVAPRGSP